MRHTPFQFINAWMPFPSSLATNVICANLSRLLKLRAIFFRLETQSNITKFLPAINIREATILISFYVHGVDLILTSFVFGVT